VTNIRNDVFFCNMFNMNKIEKIVNKNPFVYIISVIVLTVGLTYASVSYLESNKYETTINEYQSTIASIERRLGGKEVIDISKLLVLKDKSNAPLNSIYSFTDHFFSTNDKYWDYKYTSPVELVYILNNQETPEIYQNNPIDFPIHIWLGQEKFLFTGDDGEKFNLNEDFPRIISSDTSAFVVYPIAQTVFKSSIVLQKFDKKNSSHRLRRKDNIDSVYYQIDFDEITSDELMGRFLNNELSNFYNNIPVSFCDKEVLAVQKTDNVMYGQFLTTFRNMELNNKKYQSFYQWTEIIIINTENYLYTLKIDSPSTEPRKDGGSFRKVTEWFNNFGVLRN